MLKVQDTVPGAWLGSASGAKVANPFMVRAMLSPVHVVHEFTTIAVTDAPVANNNHLVRSRRTSLMTKFAYLGW